MRLIKTAGLLLLLTTIYSYTATAAELRLFAGAGLRQPVDQLITAFEKESGQRVLVDYGGNGQQVTRITNTRQGDLFMSGSLFYIEQLQAAGLVHDSRSIVQHTPVIGVNRAKTDRLTSLEDLAQPGIRVALGDPLAMALGRTALTILAKAGLQEQVLKNVVVQAATVKQLTLYVAQGAVDAAIIGRSDAVLNADKIAMVMIPADCFQAEIIAVALLTTSAQPSAAARLQHFLSSAQAVATFEHYGFLPLPEAPDKP